jgi:hypothetical protein
MLSIVMLNAVLNAVMQNLVMLGVIMLNVIMMSVVEPPHRPLANSCSTSLNQSRVLKGCYNTQHNDKQHNNK